MGHINLKINLKALPGAKYMNITGFKQPCLVIPADPEIYQFDKENNEINLSVMLWQQSYDQEHPNSPTHRASLNLSEQKRGERERQMVAYLNGLTDEQYTSFCIATFQNKQGTAKMPQTREEAARWYCSRKDRLGPAWEQKQQAPKADGAAVEATPIETEQHYDNPFDNGDDLPF